MHRGTAWCHATWPLPLHSFTVSQPAHHQSKDTLQHCLTASCHRDALHFLAWQHFACHCSYCRPLPLRLAAVARL